MRHMHIKGASSDALKVSVSSTASTSSHASAQDDYDAFRDVYVWGDIICEKSARFGAGSNSASFSSRSDILLPKPLESNVVLDIHHVACGVRHAALVTRHGEVFTWGEECGGRLGHGIGADAIHPQLVDPFLVSNVDSVSCGEFHTCAVSVTGELYTWGDGTHNVGLLGHGTNAGHWVPKRVLGPLEGLKVSTVACGTWHTALVTLTGQLFTFGDGTFGALGHGNRENALYPREVETLIGLKTVSVSCGVWHTAAVVEVIVTQNSASVPSGKLFTWGDGDKYRLGHGDKEPCLEPTCVPSLIDYNFRKVACGHSLTIGLTTSGHVFTMGSSVYGQLGNLRSDGKLPCLVEDKLSPESVGEVACGSYHVAVLTTKSEVYTWGKGANGRLGHGDFEDRKIPTLIEALKDKPVKQIACGSNFTAAICHHKWVSGAEQCQCSTCRQAFGFTRKRHNCYNCGLVHCHSCCSRKAFGAALSPNPGKAYRVCDSCYAKLSRASESGGIKSKKNVITHLSGESKDKYDKGDIKLIKHLDMKAVKNGKRADSLSLPWTPQVSSYLNMKDVAFGGGAYRHQPVKSSVSQSVTHSRAVSPLSRKPSPPRSSTPILTTSGLTFSKNITDSLMESNEFLNQEIQKLRSQAKSLKHRCELQEFELEKSAKITQEALLQASDESAKSKVAKEVIKSLMMQVKDLAERLPSGIHDTDTMRPVYLPNIVDSKAIHYSDMKVEQKLINDESRCQDVPSPMAPTNGVSDQNCAARETHTSNDMRKHYHNQRLLKPNGTEEYLNSEEEEHDNSGTSHGREDSDSKGHEHLQKNDSLSKSKSPTSASNQVETEWIEQYETGVYVTLSALYDGTRDLKRVRFSRRRFVEHQAEEWWATNREKVYEKYNVRRMHMVSSVSSSHSAFRLD